MRRLGAGAMGVVYEAKDERLGRPVALKTPTHEAAIDPGTRARFDREVRAAAAVSHRHVVGIHVVGEVGGWPFVALELVTGGSLRAHLRERGPLPWREACAVARDIADGLGAIHAAGLVHRDLKPDNVLLDEQRRAKVSDLGLARDLGARGDKLTRTGEVLGTPTYMAPEQLGESSAAGAPADLYALGCVLHELLTGEPPFPGQGFDVLAKHLTATPPSVREVARDVPPGLERLVASLLAKDPASRPSAQAVIAALQRESAAEGVATGKTGHGGPTAAIALLLLGVAAVAGAFAWSQAHRQPSPEAPPLAPSPAPAPPPLTPPPAPLPAPPAPAPASTPAGEAVPASPVVSGAEDVPPWIRERLLAAVRAQVSSGLRATLVTARGGYRFAHGDRITGLAATERSVFSAGVVIRAWDLATGAERWHLRTGTPWTYVAVDPAGRRLVCAYGHELVVLDAQDGRRLPWSEMLASNATSVAISDDGRAALVAGAALGPVLLLREGRSQLALEPALPRAKVAITGDGRRGFAAGRDGRFVTWDLDPPARGAAQQVVAIEAKGEGEDEDQDQGLFAVGASADGELVVTGGHDGRIVRVLGAELVRLAGARRPTAIAVHRRRVVAVGKGGEVVLASPDTPELVLERRRTVLDAVAFAGPSLAVVGGNEMLVRVWDLESQRLRATGAPGVLRLDATPRGLEVRRLDRSVQLLALDDLRQLGVGLGDPVPQGPPGPKQGAAGDLSAEVQDGGPRVVVTSRDGARSVTLDLATVDDRPTAVLFVAPGDLVVGTARGAVLRLRIE